MATIPADLSQYSQQAGSLTGLNPLVILSQWISENGWKVPKGYNFGNIMVPGTHTLEVYSSGAAGVAAYANFLKNNSYYKGVLATAGRDPQTQMAAIVASPWDAGHYGGDGHLLFNVYNSVSGSNIGLPSGIEGPLAPATSLEAVNTGAPAVGVSSQLVSLQTVAQGTGTGWFAGAQSIGLMILLAGLGLIVLFIGLKLVSGNTPAAIVMEAAKK